MKGEEVAITAWGIWRERCKMKTERKKGNGNKDQIYVEWALAFLYNYQKANGVCKELDCSTRVIKHYVSKNENDLGNVIMVDAAFVEERRMAASGYVVFDQERKCFAAGYRNMEFPGLALEAELQAIARGMRRSRELCLQNVKVWTDSLEAARIIDKRERCYGPIRRILEEIWSEMKDDLCSERED